MSAYTNVMAHPATLKACGEWVAQQAKELNATLMLGIGTSGLSVGAVASAMSGLLYLHVRKEGESSHGTPGQVVYPNGAAGSASELKDSEQRVIIVDDFVDSGSTVRGLIERVARESERWKIAAVVLYSSGEMTRLPRLLGEDYPDIPVRAARVKAD